MIYVPPFIVKAWPNLLFSVHGLVQGGGHVLISISPREASLMEVKRCSDLCKPLGVVLIIVLGSPVL